jgi:hypothetical protein
MKFDENPSSWSQVVLHRQTKMSKLIVAFESFVNMPKKIQFLTFGTSKLNHISC